MLIDGRTVGEGEQLEADLCVIGAGPAGISLAYALRDQPIRVLLVEAGGFDYDAEIQELYRAETGDLPYELMDMRLRYFGGSSNHWGGYCRPLESETFQQRPWVPHSGWPIGRTDLDPFYPEAARLCGLDAIELDPAVWAERFGHARVDFEGRSRLHSAVFQIAPYTHFGERYRAALIGAGNVTVALYTTVMRLHSNGAGTLVDRAEAATLSGNRFTIVAKAFVLACGGVENARVLLASKGVERNGLGNRHDMVGRFFMDHGHFHLGQLQLAPGFDPALYLERPPADERHAGLHIHLILSAATQRTERIANQSVQFDQNVTTAGEHSFNIIKRALKHGHYPERLGQHLRNVLDDLGPVTEGLGRRLRIVSDATAESSRLGLRHVGEQVPNPDSRVTLTDTVDRLGVPQARLTWRLTELDWRTMRRSGEIFAEEIGRLGLGRVQLNPEAQPSFIDGGWHHMGTTRMSDDPRQGVVDRACRVHSMGNLYIAGSSVFSTGGHGTPTMTIVALALRLAEHLRTQIFV